MIYAPMLIPTLCRAEHFIRCVESLKKNSWAKYTEVFIGLDYPAKEAHQAGYKKICDYLTGDFSEFAAFNIIKHKENVGAAKNVRSLIEAAYQKYDRFIRTDDDIEFSPNFLEFMDKALDAYQDDPDVIAVSGFSYPINWRVSDGATALKVNCVCSTWGLGFWKDKRALLENEIKKGDYFRRVADDVIKDGRINKLINCRYCSFASTLSLNNKGFMHCVTDVSLSTYLALANKTVIIPSLSKARNYGFDGSGLVCQNIKTMDNKTASSYDYRNQPIDESNSFELKMNTLDNLDENAALLNQFDSISEKSLKYAKRKIALYKKLGRKNYYRFLRLMQPFKILHKLVRKLIAI